jgi:hypothetical protein
MVRSLLLLAVVPATIATNMSMLDSDLGVEGLNPDKILCPVLAALWRNGDLKVDEFGAAERMDIKAALKDGTWCNADFAEFQSGGISDYDWTHKMDQLVRDRCLPGITGSGSKCWAKWLAGSTAKDVKRYLNIFEMNGLETVEHGMSTGVRGGNCNALPSNDICNGQYPCEALFQKFYASKADSRGRLYKEQILQIVCHALAEGDRGGEFAYYDGDVNVFGKSVAKVPSRTWQMKAAMQGWLSAFGRPDETGALYFTVDDARAMLMEGRFPDGWKKRKWACVTSLGGCPKMYDGKQDMPFFDQVNVKLPCEEQGPWWESSKDRVQTTTGESCKGTCGDPHAHCISGRCTCTKGRNGLQMLFKDGKCNEQANVRKYFGKDCRFTRANAPESTWTWSATENATWSATVLMV